ncbi:aminotransferase class IV [Proteiniborus sp. MB09-C3]|uniref:aminotransferase class IV n=1 Tax=Proteiniborus sp. MB09-C3 TaxID=3050072 RepID=UPI0025539BCD|nr:aminotransferase class IV [Proteiniborus sp. MB09-C3]WIV11753.1 aminotransferase class IV [Proteiniborus sp. MB09-C3]
MYNESILKYYMYNGEIEPTSNDEGFEKASSPLIYEVIRVIDGVPIFLEGHIERMRKSAELIGKTIKKTDEEIKQEIHRLIDSNKEYNMNIKLLCSNVDSPNQTFMAYYIKSSYPEKEVYEKGIHTILFHSERENPNAKIVNADLRQRINDEIKEQNAYEALLVNRKGYITEGSRSNMFFVKGDKVYTASAGDVLLGITRNEIMNVCKEQNIEVIEEEVHMDSLKDLDGAFMTGTSVNALPIATIDDIKLDSVNNSIIKRIAEGYLQKMQEYIKLNIKK